VIVQENDGMAGDALLPPGKAHFLGGGRLDVDRLRLDGTTVCQPFLHGGDVAGEAGGLTDDGDIGIAEGQTLEADEVDDPLQQGDRVHP